MNIIPNPNTATVAGWQALPSGKFHLTQIYNLRLRRNKMAVGLGGGQGWQEQRGQNGDDRDNDQKFDEGKGG